MHQTYGDPNPFDHGQSTIKYNRLPMSKFQPIIQLINGGWPHLLHEEGKLVTLESLATGAEVNSKNFRLTFDNGQKYVLKRTPIQSVYWQIRYSAFVMTLRDNGVLHPKQSVPMTGDGFCVPFGNHHYRLYEYFDGEHFDGSRAQLISAAKYIARMHHAMSVVPNEWFMEELGEQKIAKEKNSVYYLTELARIRQIIMAKENKIDDFDAMVLGLMPELIDASQSINCCTFAKLTSQIIHYDMHPYNALFFTKHDQVGILDLDSSIVSQLARDVGFAMHRFARTYGSRTERKHDVGSSINERAILFLENYQSINPLKQNELKLIPILLQDEAMTRILNILISYYVNQDSRWKFDLEKQITLLTEAQQLSL